MTWRRAHGHPTAHYFGPLGRRLCDGERHDDAVDLPLSDDLCCESCWAILLRDPVTVEGGNVTVEVTAMIGETVRDQNRAALRCAARLIRCGPRPALPVVLLYEGCLSALILPTWAVEVQAGGYA